MEDNVSPPGEKEKMLDAFRELSKCNHVLGLYGVDTDFMEEWDGQLKAIPGLKFAIQSAKRANPVLPSID